MYLKEILYERGLTNQDIAERLIEDAADRTARWSLGVHEIDDALGGGLKPRELLLVAGKAHTGKTVLLINAVAKNPDSLVIWMTPDEPDLMVLSRVLSIRLNMNPPIVTIFAGVIFVELRAG